MISALTIKSLNPNRWPFSCYNYRKSYCLVDQISDGVTGQRGPPGNDACCLLFVFVCVCWWWPLTETQTTHIREKTCSVFKRDRTCFCLKELTDVFLVFHPVKIRRYWFKKIYIFIFSFFCSSGQTFTFDVYTSFTNGWRHFPVNWNERVYVERMDQHLGMAFILGQPLLHSWGFICPFNETLITAVFTVENLTGRRTSCLCLQRSDIEMQLVFLTATLMLRVFNLNHFTS